MHVPGHMTRWVSSLALIVVALVCGCSDPGKKQQPLAIKGTIDLSKWNFKSDGPVKLNGEWECYDMKRLGPGDFAKIGPTVGRAYNRVPDDWSIGLKLYNVDFLLGHATYRLKIITDGSITMPLGLSVNIIHSAYSLYINGVLMHEAGRTQSDLDKIVAGYSQSIVPLPAAQGEYEIIIQAANFQFPDGSIHFVIDIGSLPQLQEFLQRSNLISVILLILILMFTLNQFILFALQRSELQYLYFGLACVGILLYTIGLHSSYWSSIFPFFPWDRTNKYMTCVMYVGNVFFMGYIQRLFPLDMSKRILYLYGVISIVLGIAIVALPEKTFASLLWVYHVHVIVSSLLFLFIVIRAAIMRREDSLIVIIGLISSPISIANEILNWRDVLDRNIDTMAASMVIFCFVQTIGTMRNYFRIHRRLKMIAANYEMLKTKVNERIKSDSKAITDSMESKIDVAIEYLRQNYAEDISRENLASTINLHPDSFSRYFKIRTGKKFNEYLNELRITEAVRLLRETDDPIITIAMNVGFNSLRTFNHVFITVTGHKPSDYRNMPEIHTPV